ncbi:TPA: DUF3265 domain-containing protein [Vibrio parahaemolyticus]|nr:DUF3265 domain-containing protein [Vibrio parahaemolyticus]AWA89692.1 DUF3265 domain-containing protein [Vibrio parahaemolyticus]EGQ8686202.1 DUF3265 domain-containing protein [Vibrio parahaemolyticus]EGQ8784286.1 DUF3265 domain-containing protein [Vibrio parahaemolyticus]EGQ8832802.1 DUF3265 domain-containing protein [Vibrio parahaemolyticus]
MKELGLWLITLMIDFTVCREQSPNKQFKRDSARVAFLVCGGFGVEVQYGGLVIACFTP